MDMLVPLYRLGAGDDYLRRVSTQGVTIRRALAHERDAVVEWVRSNFDGGWAAECAVTFASMPTTCHIAVHDGDLLGFSCHDVTARGLFGPTGTAVDSRGKGIGAALLVASLNAMRESGYAYAVIGGTDEGLAGFYRKVAGATPIAGSEPGVYGAPISRR